MIMCQDSVETNSDIRDDSFEKVSRCHAGCLSTTGRNLPGSRSAIPRSLQSDNGQAAPRRKLSSGNTEIESIPIYQPSEEVCRKLREAAQRDAPSFLESLRKG